MKRPLRKIYDPMHDAQHIQGIPIIGSATLCGQTDWSDLLEAGLEAEEDTPKPINCAACQDIFDYCNKGSWPK